MKAVNCLNCKAVFVYDAKDEGRYDLTIGCPHCGYKDYAYVFHGLSKKRSQSALTLNRQFIIDLENLCNCIERAQLDVYIGNISKQYQISSDNLVWLINALLKDNTVNNNPNPLRFRILDEEHISVGKLMQSLEQALDSMPSSKEEKQNNVAVSDEDISPWRRRCNELEDMIHKEREEKTQLISQLHLFKEEIEKYKEMLKG